MSDVATRVDWLKTLPPGGVGAEIGVLRGDFAHEMLCFAHPQLLYLVDCWGGIQPHVRKKRLEDLQFTMERMAPHIVSGQVRVVCAYSVQAAKLVRYGLDWVYIDAHHSYKSVLADLHAWYPKVRPGGYVAGHDYDDRYGVPRAVKRFFADAQLDPALLNVTTKGMNDGGQGNTPSFWMRKPEEKTR